ncbi:unnamed protein product [Rotaria sordida]|uniref:NAD(P)(+)--arginine ADP-ribosyltransferase n=2 Tax=Rotaria sordida TaxID=392033 RepID=A0A815STQ0_9BILA|nr:unnamed protein product [Rotaria sordida]CAF3976806.1 unnamed protein product [Rotaria sordida]
MLPPIQGYDEQPLVSLEKAIEPLKSIVPQVDHMVWTVKQSLIEPKDDLSKDESSSIMLYTLEWPPPDKSFYNILNEKLRSRDRRQLTPWFLYLRLFIHALSKLPPSVHRVIYRGVKMDLASRYCEGNNFVWWAFSSCTSSIGVLDNHIGKNGKRTIFNITCNSAKDISQHSYHPDEKEVLLYPARQFKVNSSLDVGHELHIIDIEEIEPPFSLIRFPPTEKPNIDSSVKHKKSLSATDQFINILLLGEKGVGKSTFINAFANYLTFKTVEQAQSKRPVVLKPLSFVTMTNDTFQQQTITYGDFDHDSELITRCCRTYTFNLNQNNEKKLCLIDTPSFEDTQDFDQDNSKTIKHILEYVNNITHLNAICFLLQPDESRLMNSFQSCFSQLLNRLGSNARKNIIFCFTNALMTFSMPGNTARLLRNMFTSLSMNNIPFDRTNTFFFDNESFRYLMAIQNGIEFSNEDTTEYTMSWLESVQESNRFLNYILTNLIPCQIIKKK